METNTYLRQIALSFFIISFFMSAYCQVKHDSTSYYLKLETGKVIYGNLNYVIPYIGGDYVRVNDTNYYTPDISSFQCSWGYFSKFRLDSLSPKVEIYKRTREGKLDFYTGKTTEFTPGVGNMGPMAYDYKEKYFSKDKVHLLEVNYENLSRSLSDNPISLEFLQQYKTARNMEWGLAATGIVSAAIGIIQIDHRRFVSGSLFTSIVFILFAWNRGNVQDAALKNAIREYNEK